MTTGFLFLMRYLKKSGSGLLLGAGVGAGAGK